MITIISLESSIWVRIRTRRSVYLLHRSCSVRRRRCRHRGKFAWSSGSFSIRPVACIELADATANIMKKNDEWLAVWLDCCEAAKLALARQQLKEFFRS